MNDVSPFLTYDAAECELRLIAYLSVHGSTEFQRLRSRLYPQMYHGYVYEVINKLVDAEVLGWWHGELYLLT